MIRSLLPIVVNILLVALGTSTAFAQSSTVSTSQKSLKKVEEKSNLTFAISYELVANIMEESRANALHNFTAGLSWLGADPWILSVGSGFNYISNGDKISLRSENPSLEDLDFTISRSFKMSSINQLNSELTLTLPSGSVAQYEQYRFILMNNNRLATSISQQLVMVNTLSVGGIAHSYEFSPGSNKRNHMAFAAWKISFGVLTTKNFKFGAAAGIKSSLLTDQTSSLSGQTALFAIIPLKKWTFEAAYTNGSYEDEGPARLWNIDQYNQVVKTRISYEF